MKLPTLKSIATRPVVMIDKRASLNEAAKQMHAHDLRDLVVLGEPLSLIDAQSLIRFQLENVDFATGLSQLDLPVLESLHEETGLLEALEKSRHESEYLCLIDDANKPSGILSYSDLIANIDPDRVVESLTLEELLPAGGVCTSDADIPAALALKKMRDERSDAVVIVRGEKPIGILTQKDAISLFAEQKDLQASARTYMSAPLKTVPPSMRVWEAYEYLRRHRFKRLVISQDDRLLGVMTQRKLVSESFAKRMELIRQHEEKLRLSGRLDELGAIRTVGTIDGLTGLFNRQMFNELLRREAARARRYKEPLSLILIDIDHFKKINDTHGHLIGDRVLIALSSELQQIIRTSDLLCRWGGEEFALLLPHTDLSGALQAGEKIRTHIEQFGFETVGRVTLSMGATAFSAEDTHEEALFLRADEALYRAKNSGRNRICSG